MRPFERSLARLNRKIGKLHPQRRPFRRAKGIRLMHRQAEGKTETKEGQCDCAKPSTSLKRLMISIAESPAKYNHAPKKARTFALKKNKLPDKPLKKIQFSISQKKYFFGVPYLNDTRNARIMSKRINKNRCLYTYICVQKEI